MTFPSEKRFINSSEVLLGNCKDHLRTFIAGQFHMVLTSPPYFNQKECAVGGTSSEGEYKTREEYFKDMEEIIDLCINVSKDGAIFAINIGADATYDLRAWLSLLLQNKGLKYIDTISWVKGSGNVVRGFHIEARNCYYPFLAWEPIYIYQVKKHTYQIEDKDFPRFEERFKDLISSLLRTNVWQIPQDNEAPWHPAPYPRKLAYNLIAAYTEPNTLILDPFGGAMTTAVATNEVGNGRKYVCIELIKERYEKGLQRINENSQQGLGL